MASSELRLLGLWSSPFLLRTMIALNMKSLEYEYLHETHGIKSQLLHYKPVYKKVPVLLHGDKPICESLIIVQYIDDVWTNGPSILPADPYDRAIARFWASYIDDKWFPSMLAILRGEEGKAAAIEQLESGLKVLEEAFDNCSKGNGFFGGESIGYLGIILGCHLVWLKVTEIRNDLKVLDDEKTPLLSAWSERFCSDVILKEIMPETEKLIDLSKQLFKK